MTPTPELKRLAEEARDRLSAFFDGQHAPLNVYQPGKVRASVRADLLHLIEENERLREAGERAAVWLEDCADVMGSPPPRRDVKKAREWRASIVREWADRTRQALGGQSHE